jgi:glucose-fructose oxidoreductase
MNSIDSCNRRKFLGQMAIVGAAVLALPRRMRAAEAAPQKRLGIAFAGLGSYASHQLAPAIRHTKFCRIAGVITGTPAKGRKWERQYDLPPASVYSYETLERVADNPDIDIVYVVTPPGTHRDLVVRAAKAGKHVICEKPMAGTVRDCDEMIAACAAAGKKLSIGYRLQFEPHHIELERLARDAQFGPLARMKGAHGFYLDGRQWRVDKKLAGGGPLPDVGIYVIQAACRTAGGAPLAVTAHEEPKTRPELFATVEEAMRWKMEFAGGAVADCFTSYNEGANEFRAESADGKNWVELSPAFYYDGIDGRTSRGPLKQPNVPQQAWQMDDFVRSILDGRDSPVPGEMGRRDIAIMEAIYESAKTGRRVTL